MSTNHSTGKTFSGGIHPPEFKELAAAKATVDVPPSAEVAIPLQQHVGAPCEPLVKVGDKVVAGQKIGDSKSFVSAPVHSSVAGTVKAIESRPHFNGQTVNSIVITVEPGDTVNTIELPGPWEKLTPEQIRKLAREAGLVGMGGATFPSHVKLNPPADKPIDSVIINGCECEPFLTCDYRGLLERPDSVLIGLQLMARAVGAEKMYIGIEDNKPDAIKVMADTVRELGVPVEVVTLRTKYPEGAEKQLIKAVLDREVPPGALPMEIGALVHNVGTAIALADAATKGIPLFERVLTVTGPAIKEPANVRVKIGTPIGHIIEFCGGFGIDPRRVVLGGPMTGFAQSSLDVVVSKGTTGIVCLTPEMVDDRPPRDCVRCGKCLPGCPMFLMPNFISTYAEAGKWAEAEAWGALDCFECGSCGYVCPAKRPIVGHVRRAKAEIMARRSRNK